MKTLKILEESIMRKLFALLLAAMLLVTLAACGNSTHDYNPAADTPFDSAPTISDTTHAPTDLALRL